MTGSVLVTGGAGLIAVPYGALIGLPAAIVGLFMCVPSTLGPLHPDISNARRGMAQALITLGGLALLVACVTTAVLAVEHVVALRRGRALPLDWSISLAAGAALAAAASLAGASALRARLSGTALVLRVAYWLAHPPATLAAVALYAALRVPLTA